MDISVVIVSWNTCTILAKCLKSIYKQVGDVRFEVIVVDNASQDDSVLMVKTKFPQVVVISNSENLGFARANNIGIREASGRYICLVNSDVVVLDGCINRLITFMDQNSNVGMSGPRILNPEHTLQHSCFHFPSVWNNFCQALGLNKLFPKSALFSGTLMKYWRHDSERSVDVLNGCFWMVRRQAIDQVGLLDEDFFIYGEDIDWCRRFHKAGWDVVFYPRVEAIHFGGASSGNAPIKFYLEMQKADLHYWRKQHGRIGESGYLLIILLRQLVRMPVFALTYVFRARNRKTAQFKLKRAFACIGFLFGFDIDK